MTGRRYASYPRLRIGLVLLGLLFDACATTEPPGPLARLEVISGVDQAGPVALTLPEPIGVRLVDASGRALDGFPLVFQVSLGDGSLGPAAVKRISTLTESDGTAAVSWRLGTKVGPQKATVTVESMDPVLFQAEARPGPPVLLAGVSGSAQRGPVGAELPEPFVAALLDEYGNGIPGQPLEWKIDTGSGAFSGPQAETDAAGISSMVFVPGEIGEIVVTANRFGFEPASFRTFGQALLIDPAGDSFGTAVNYVPTDVVQAKAWIEEGELQIRIWFTEFQVSGRQAGEQALAGYVDLDVDQDPTTGAVPFTDRLRPQSGSTGLGAEFSVSLLTTTERFDVLDRSGDVIGTVRGRFAGNTVRMWIPLDLIDDDGLVDLAMIVGTVHELSDIAPDQGHLAMAPPSGGN